MCHAAAKADTASKGMAATMASCCTVIYLQLSAKLDQQIAE